MGVMDDAFDPGTLALDGEISDDELAAEALAADPRPDLVDAVPFAWVIGTSTAAALPEWYMPPPMVGGPRLAGWRRGVVVLFIGSLLVIEVAGLCTTYGRLA